MHPFTAKSSHKKSRISYLLAHDILKAVAAAFYVKKGSVLSEKFNVASFIVIRKVGKLMLKKV